MDTNPSNCDSEQLAMLDSVRLCCLALASTLGSERLAYPDNPAYNTSLGSYYSVQQESIRPACILFPKTVNDVSTAVKTLSKSGKPGSCNFAIRSGGHTSWAGASNIDGGVTLDLRGLSNVDVKEDGTVVQVGTGATWDDVYKTLDPIGKGAAGGRVAGVGVGGLTVGGGISHFSPQHGWTCDTVRNFQVVLSDGKIVDANAKQNSDLFFALRGGGNNFGIVTRIDLETFELGLIWSGFFVSDNSHVQENIKEFVRLSAAKDYDQHASFMLSFGYGGSLVPTVVNTLVYTKPVENPPVYKKLLEFPALMSVSGIKNYTAASEELAGFVPGGTRSIYRTRTVVSTEPVLQAVYSIWEKALVTLNTIPGMGGSVALEPLPPVFYERHAAENALGLTNRKSAPLVVILLDIRWTNASDDKVVQSTCKKLIDDIEKEARKLGAYDQFIYSNYAEPDQNPIATYGKENVARLKAVRKRVDPTQVFTKQVPGGHKLP